MGCSILMYRIIALLAHAPIAEKLHFEKVRLYYVYYSQRPCAYIRVEVMLTYRHMC